MTDLNIRETTFDDVPTLLTLGAQLHVESTFAQLPLDPETLAGTLIRLQEAEDGLVLLADGGAPLGMLAAEIRPSFFGPARVAKEYLVYVVPEARRRKVGETLAQRYVEWADQRGADRVNMENWAGMEDGSFVRLMERLGFVRAGSAMYREV